jgi:hypothetical protein
MGFAHGWRVGRDATETMTNDPELPDEQPEDRGIESVISPY